MRCEKWKDREFLEKQRQSCERSPRTYQQIEDVISLFEVYGEISHLSMWAARPLVYEKNMEVQKMAVAQIAIEMAKISNPSNPTFSITRSLVTEGRIQEILRETRILVEGTDMQREKLEAQKKQTDKEVQYTCPLCGKLITVTLSKRDKIVSLRTTPEADDAYAYLAKEFDVSRSKILSVLLGMRPKFPNMFKD